MPFNGLESLKKTRLRFLTYENLPLKCRVFGGGRGSLIEGLQVLAKKVVKLCD